VAESVRQGDVCYDIGAHRGFFSGVFALAGAGRVIAFEPFPENCTQLQCVFAQNPDLPLTLEQTAIGKEDGIVEFNVMPDSSMGKLASSSFQSDIESAGVLKVSVRSLDSLISDGKYPAPQIIKIDVEGAEVDLLEGARNILLTKKPLLFIEAHSKSLAAECTTLLEGLDYRVSVFEDEAGREESATLDVCHLVATQRSF